MGNLLQTPVDNARDNAQANAEDKPPSALARPTITTTITQDNRDEALRRLPRFARIALSYAANIRRGSLTVQLPDGRHLRFVGAESGPAADMIVRDFAFGARLVTGGDIGFAESYLRGEWDTPDLTRFIFLFCVNHDVIATLMDSNPVMRVLQQVRHWLNRNTRQQAKRNIYAHYDIGNRFYGAWLDQTMTYSAALFENGIHDLATAQRAKYRRLAEAMEIGAGKRLLEIGCGWGGFAEHVAKTCGVRVVGLTISRQQFDYARRRIFEAGLSEQVDIRFQDYRDERGKYDHIASIEMIEAVGERFWPHYFAQLRDRLVPGGTAGIQAITIQDRFFATYRREVDFIQRYVFPGGMLPSPAVLRALGERFGLPIRRERLFGEDYAKTLAAWRDNFRAAWPQLLEQGFDERFRRLWEYYLAYCEAGFRSGNIDVRQVVFARPP